jgi:hypothetical protein
MSTSLGARMLLTALFVLAFSAAATVQVAADAPLALPFFQQFDDLNPCSGQTHTITVSGTAYVNDENGALIVHVDRSIATNSGFEGRGTSTLVDNGQVSKFSLRDTLTNVSGERIRAGFILVIDLSTGEAKAFHGAVTCVR